MQNLIPAEFNGTPLNIIDRDGQKWLTAEEIGRCLGYNEANSGVGVRNLYNRHADEFTEADTCRIKLMRQGQNREVLIFSAEGCVMLAMFANTPRAKEFRAWAKKVLAAQPAPAIPADPLAIPGLKMILDANRDMAREVGQMKDLVAAQNQAILALYRQVDGARVGHIRALGKLLTLQERQSKLLAAQEKREAKETILRLEAEGIPREIIAQRTGRTLNHIRQVVFQARQGELGLAA